MDYNIYIFRTYNYNWTHKLGVGHVTTLFRSKYFTLHSDGLSVLLGSCTNSHVYNF